MAIERRSVLAGSALAMAAAVSPASGRPDRASESADIAAWLRVNALLQTCADSLDRCDAAAFGAIFTADGVFDYKPGTILRGRAEIVAGAAAAFAQVMRSSHHVGPPIVVPGKTATAWRATAYFSAHHLLRNGKRFTLHGRYEDRLEADPADGAMRIARRRVIGHLGDGASDPEERYWLRSP